MEADYISLRIENELPRFLTFFSRPPRTEKVREDMSENSSNVSYGMIYFIQPGDTPEYLEELRKRGFFPVQINVDEEFEKAHENTVITAVSFDATDTTSGAYPISTNNVTFVVNPDRNLPDHLICTVKKDDTASDSTNRNEIVVTLADDDAKNIFGLFGPGPRSITLIDTDDAANRNEIVVTLADDNISVVTVLLSSNEKSYIVIRDNDPSKSYKLYRVSDYINPETGRLEDIPIPSIVFDATDDSSQNNYLDGPTYSVNWPESTDTTPQVYKLVLVDGEPLKLIPVIDGSMAFINTVDAETAAVTSVQVACAEDGGWHTIGTLNNPDGIDWKYQAGNLTGSGTASVVWHAQELGALGVWTDGTDNWTAVDGWFDANWTMLGCGDFDGDGKDSVLMSLNGGLFYSVDLDGTLSSLGGLNWSGWEFGAVGDFAGDGKDDIVLFHRESGTVVLLADGNADAFERLGQLDATDWSVAGAGDFDADGKDDLLVRQNSTGIAGAYASADMSKWSTVSSDYLLA